MQIPRMENVRSKFRLERFCFRNEAESDLCLQSTFETSRRAEERAKLGSRYKHCFIILHSPSPVT